MIGHPVIRILAVFPCLLAASTLAIHTSFAAPVASVPPFMNFQGYLTDTSGNPATGIHDMKFKILYGATPIWSADYTTVAVANGNFSVLLGDTTQGGTAVTPIDSILLNSVDSSALVTIELTVDNDLLSPDFTMASTMFAMKADSVGPYSVSELAHYDAPSGSILSSGGIPVINSAGNWIGPGGGGVGTTGTTGATGSNGAMGVSGATGASGASGSNGTNGTNGAIGATGASGTNGTNGTNGAVGNTGVTGASGANGSNGTNGTNGAVGNTGATGTNGSNGAIGVTGASPFIATGPSGYYVTGYNVGIGTAAPGALLQISEAETGAPPFLITDSTVGGATFSVDQHGRTTLTGLGATPLTVTQSGPPATADYLDVTTIGGSMLFNVDKNGNVGVGTTSPSSLFSVGPGATSPFQINSSGVITEVGGYSSLIGGTSIEISSNSGLVIGNGITNGSTIIQGTNNVSTSGSLTLESTGGSSGTSDYINFITGPAKEAMRITTAGNVGIGTTAPTSALDVTGSIYARSFDDGAGSAIDWNKANAQTTSVAPGAITFTNMQDGGSYTLACTNATSGTFTFSQTGLTFYFSPANAATLVNTMTVYTFLRIGANVYVSWIAGFQ